jgi:leucyl aminopeptidase
MIQVLVKKATDTKHSASTLVVFVRKSDKKSEALGANAEVAHYIGQLIEDGLSDADLKKGVFFRNADVAPHRHLLVIGLDEKFKTLEDVRTAAATTYQLLKSNKAGSGAVIFDGLAKGFVNVALVAQAFTEGAQLAAHEFIQYKTKKKDEDKNKVDSIQFLVGKKLNAANIEKGIDVGQTLAECVIFARNVGNTPGNLMTPEHIADEIHKAAKGTKLKVTVWDKARIKKEKMGGLLGVSLGSAVDPRFFILEYNGAAKSKKPVCFVGKALTFDSGGISIKPSGGMEEMKFDKCGGVNVIATLLAIAKLKLKVNAIALVPSTENMPGPLANKPGDILVARNGKTVEVDNTDAEGRLILMDALSYASELKPAAIYDAATLTGACVIALGNSYTGCFTRDKKVRKRVNDAAEDSGEMVWHMPIHDHHVADMKGTYADLNNISSFKGGGSSTAAAFLEQFVDKDIPWAHFDIAGTAWHTGNRLNYCPKKGATGVMIRTFVELAKQYS